MDRGLVEALRQAWEGERCAQAPAPEEEAMALRAVLAGNPDLPRPLLVQVWRELAGAARPARVASWNAAAEARARFGAAARLSAVASPEAALEACARGDLAMLALDPRQPWWARLLARPRLSVFDRVDGALAVGPLWSQPSGADVTLWVTDAPGPAAAIEAALGRIGFAADLAAEAGGLKLFALAGYVQRDDARLAEAPGRLSGVIGAVPLIEP